MKLTSNPKPVKFRIVSGGEEHSSLDSLRRNFCVDDLKQIESQLRQWLSRQGKEGEQIAQGLQELHEKDDYLAFYKLFFQEDFNRYEIENLTQLLNNWWENESLKKNATYLINWGLENNADIAELCYKEKIKELSLDEWINIFEKFGTQNERILQLLQEIREKKEEEEKKKLLTILTGKQRSEEEERKSPEVLKGGLSGYTTWRSQLSREELEEMDRKRCAEWEADWKEKKERERQKIQEEEQKKEDFFNQRREDRFRYMNIESMKRYIYSIWRYNEEIPACSSSDEYRLLKFVKECKDECEGYSFTTPNMLFANRIDSLSLFNRRDMWNEFTTEPLFDLQAFIETLHVYTGKKPYRWMETAAHFYKPTEYLLDDYIAGLFGWEFTKKPFKEQVESFFLDHLFEY